MKFWFPSWPLLDYSNPHRAIPCNTLHLRCCHRLLVRSTYLPRRKLRLTNSKCSRQRRILLLHLHLHTYWAGSLLRLLPLQRDLKHRSSPAPISYNDCLRGLRPPMRSNILLRGHRHHQPPVRCTLRRKHSRPMNLRRLFSRQCHPYPLLRLPLFIPLHYCGGNRHPSAFPPRNRIQQPPWP